MRYALILAGGSGLRLWPMSRRSLPKQLIPFLEGKSLLEVSVDRLSGLVAPERQYICANRAHRQHILQTLAGWPAERFIGEPVGRDTLCAVGVSTAILATEDPEAVVAIFTADHLIEPVEEFRRIISQGYALVENHPNYLVTFGIVPSEASTNFGYLELGKEMENGSRRVSRFQEKPSAEKAEAFLQAGPDRYLWNSGMFVWKASTLLECIRRYEPLIYDQILFLAREWKQADTNPLWPEVYSQVKKISIDYAVMEPASNDPEVTIASFSMPLRWLDVGSWPAYARTCRQDPQGNAIAADKAVTWNASSNLMVSDDPQHLIVLAGCENLAVIHTSDATLVFRTDCAESLKQIHSLVQERFGEQFL